MLVNGDGVPKDHSRARVLGERSCAAGALRGCTALALLLEKGSGGPADEGRAVQLYRRACEGGEPRGCANLGAVHLKGRLGLATDLDLAAAFYEQACKGKIASA